MTPYYIMQNSINLDFFRSSFLLYRIIPMTICSKIPYFASRKSEGSPRIQKS